MNEQVNVGIIGYGLAGRVFHAPLISADAGFRLAKIVTTDPGRIAAVHQRYPGTLTVNKADSVFEDNDISLVIVATPNELHYEQTKQALLAGKHVISDKPFTVTTAEADDLIKIAKERNLLMTAFQNRRWDSDFLTIKKLIDHKRLGELAEAEFHFDRFRKFIKPGTWKEESRPGTGILYDLGSHLIDQALVLFGLPLAVSGFLSTQRNQGKTIDNFEIILHYQKLKVTIKAGMLVRPLLPRYILLGQDGAFVKYGLDVQEPQLDNGILPADSQYGIEPEEIWGTLYDGNEGSIQKEIITSERGNYPAFYRNVYNAITNGEKLMVDPVEARNIIRVIELAVLSAKEMRTVSFD